MKICKDLLLLVVKLEQILLHDGDQWSDMFSKVLLWLDTFTQTAKTTISVLWSHFDSTKQQFEYFVSQFYNSRMLEYIQDWTQYMKYSINTEWAIKVALSILNHIQVILREKAIVIVSLPWNVGFVLSCCFILFSVSVWKHEDQSWEHSCEIPVVDSK